MTNASRIAWVVGVGASRGLGAASARRMIFPQMRSAALADPDPALTLRACTTGCKLFPLCGSWRCHGLARGD